jgi:hypothetical protein
MTGATGHHSSEKKRFILLEALKGHEELLFVCPVDTLGLIDHEYIVYLHWMSG